MRSPLFVSCLLFLPTLLPAQGRGANEGPKLEHFTAESGTLKSDKVRSGDAGYTIWLPKGHGDAANKDKVWAFAIWLSGFGGNNEFADGGGLGVLDRLRGENKIPEMAFVVYRGPGRRTFYMNSENACDTEDLLVGDFLTHLQTKYRLATDKKQRALMGVSAGGFGALKLALRHPDVFGVVAAHSAAILPVDPEDIGGMTETAVLRALRQGVGKEVGDPIDKAKWQAHMPLAIVAAKKPADLDGMQIYFDAGTDDGYDFCTPNEKLSQVMTATGHKHLFRKVEGGEHAFGNPLMLDNVAKSLQFVGAAFAGKDAVAELTPKAADAKTEPKDDGKGGK
jgi:enterochelin esterase-like enzyme